LQQERCVDDTGGELYATVDNEHGRYDPAQLAAGRHDEVGDDVQRDYAVVRHGNVFHDDFDHGIVYRQLGDPLLDERLDGRRDHESGCRLDDQRTVDGADRTRLVDRNR
jgi:hypothetical protein